MKIETDVLSATTNYYDREANTLVAAYDAAEMSELHQILLSTLNPKSKIMDIGFGSGRDLSFLKEHGFDVWGIDASKEFIALARERFSDVSDHFYCAELPHLKVSKGIGHSFDAVILIAVWMHLPLSVYAESIKQICSLLQLSGKVVVSYSITPRIGETERYFENVDGILMEKLFKMNGCNKVYQSTNEDGLQSRSIIWKTEVYSYDKP